MTQYLIGASHNSFCSISLFVNVYIVKVKSSRIWTLQESICDNTIRVYNWSKIVDDIIRYECPEIVS